MAIAGGGGGQGYPESAGSTRGRGGNPTNAPVDLMLVLVTEDMMDIGPYPYRAGKPAKKGSGSGGGGSYNPTTAGAGDGGSGIVVVRYQIGDSQTEYSKSNWWCNKFL